jgi:hypothetical protein
MVWGCVSGLNLNHLIRAPSRMNGEKYGNIILDVVYPMVMVAEEAIFQEDNAPIHKSKPVKELKDNLGIVTMEWPAQSPDLSPIENVWRDIKCWIHKNRKPQTEADLEEAVFAAWNTITFEKILHFIDSMPERINEVIEKNGHAIHY